MYFINKGLKMKKLDKLFKRAKVIPTSKNTKIVVMSDIHRGINNINDNFHKNKLLYEEALKHYYKKGFTYIELGDGDDMWEVNDYYKIIETYKETFKLLKKFYLKKQLLMIYGNHDICKRKKKILEKYFYTYYDKRKNKNEELLNNLNVYEAIVLNYRNLKIFMLHGHQVDFLNSNIWRISRFLVKYIWKKLETIGFRAPMTLAKNYELPNKNEKKLINFSNKKKMMVISGHTHKAIFPINNTSLYFNDGACVHKDGITCLEIKNDKISLIKWFYKAKKNKILFKRKILNEKKLIIE